MTNCDKCQSIHNAQEKGLQAKPCECDCHDKLENDNWNSGRQGLYKDEMILCQDNAYTKYDGVIEQPIRQEVNEEQANCPHCVILPSGTHITSIYHKCNKKKIPICLLEGQYKDWIIPVEEPCPEGYEVKILACKDVHDTPKCNITHKYYVLPIKRS